MPGKGNVRVQVLKENTYIPIDKAKVTVTEVSENRLRQGSTVLISDSSGLTKEIEVETPPIENSMNPTNKLPYSFVDINVEADGFQPVIIKGCQVFPDRVALQQVRMEPPKRNARQEERLIIVQPNTLVGNFPPKIPEDPNKPLPPPPSGFVVLPEPVVPEFIVVHAGVPDDSTAPNYTVRFKDYVKNVASCEIFSTWPESTIRANVYCIVSFALNRVYTEWYRGKGKGFQITNSTAFDQAFNYGRNIYDNINRIVDELFSTYVKRPARKQPLLTQYCDGQNVQCPGWLTQWGSKYLGDQGKAPFEILTNFYGDNLTLVRAEQVQGIPSSYPGYVLTVGSRGPAVRTVQTYLNRIADNYPAINKQAVDGIYGNATRDAVKQFQSIFSLPATGDVDYPTWYRISDIYVAVTKIGELRGDYRTSERTFFPPMTYEMNNMTDVPKVKYKDEYYNI
ncbi:peptidoglycan-binding protein [Clostridium sp. MSJ-4]|uniref:Peptidoglycan-binding protein n=1 Tax=Clostridium simiarum TaxID=2841506 RepID=A0ABS6F126_9CLOT|nr:MULTISPECIES: peptidoglycan-binding domain-containing protein [Clostridium]MBU5592183.1 peptidoglycan-binding protein [Clostridium simiarum]